MLAAGRPRLTAPFPFGVVLWATYVFVLRFSGPVQAELGRDTHILVNDEKSQGLLGGLHGGGGFRLCHGGSGMGQAVFVGGLDEGVEERVRL